MLLHFNETIDAAWRHRELGFTFYSHAWIELALIGWQDLSWENVNSEGIMEDEPNDLDSEFESVTLESQAGYVIGFTTEEALKECTGLVSMASCLSHKLKRKVRSSLAAESAAGKNAKRQWT